MPGTYADVIRINASFPATLEIRYCAHMTVGHQSIGLGGAQNSKVIGKIRPISNCQEISSLTCSIVRNGSGRYRFAKNGQICKFSLAHTP
jgi:hypothetical protein